MRGLYILAIMWNNWKNVSGKVLQNLDRLIPSYDIKVCNGSKSYSSHSCSLLFCIDMYFSKSLSWMEKGNVPLRNKMLLYIFDNCSFIIRSHNGPQPTSAMGPDVITSRFSWKNFF